MTVGCCLICTLTVKGEECQQMFPVPHITHYILYKQNMLPSGFHWDFFPAETGRVTERLSLEIGVAVDVLIQCNT